MTTNQKLHDAASCIMAVVPFAYGLTINVVEVDLRMLPFAVVSIPASYWLACRWHIVAVGQCGGCRRVKKVVDLWA